jgi:hypothetical protein
MTEHLEHAEGMNAEAVTRWIADNAHPLTALDPRTPPADLEPLAHLVRNAIVVGLGSSTRGAHELTTLMHRVLRFLVEELGFRALAVEEDWTKGIQIDEYLRTGRGDPRALLADAWPLRPAAGMAVPTHHLRSSTADSTAGLADHPFVLAVGSEPANAASAAFAARERRSFGWSTLTLRVSTQWWPPSWRPPVSEAEPSSRARTSSRDPTTRTSQLPIPPPAGSIHTTPDNPTAAAGGRSRHPCSWSSHGQPSTRKRRQPGSRPRLTCRFSGADDGTRTRDPHLGKVMLYQLSHVRVGESL